MTGKGDKDKGQRGKDKGKKFKANNLVAFSVGHRPTDRGKKARGKK